jgi:tetratricopeptide (TPR) repeat protein
MMTCFVISPIGQEGSDVRKNADDLFELIIEPALDKYEFKVVRGDMFNTTTSITDDVIKLIQSSELCIIDLTGHNPNVFYECGRRHETAKPFILMKRKGEDTPFDLKDIRTVDYDLSDPRKTKISINNLRRFVNEFEEAGYGSESSTASLTSIATSLNRLERKIDSLGTSAPANSVSSDGAPVSGSPALVFRNAVSQNDTATAVKALKRFMQISSDVNLHLDMASILVENYEPLGVPIVRAIMEKDFDNLQPGKLAIALHGLYTYFVGALKIQDEYNYLSEFTKKALEKKNTSNKDNAALFNVLASLEFSLKNDIQSLKYQEKTIELNPTESAYYYNICRLYEELGNTDDLAKNLGMLVSVIKSKFANKEPINSTYLEYARKFFVQNNLLNKVNEIDEIVAGLLKQPVKV